MPEGNENHRWSGLIGGLQCASDFNLTNFAKNDLVFLEGLCRINGEL